MPARSERTLGSVIDLLADRLQPAFHLTLQRYQVGLRERMAAERDGTRLGDWVDAREALVRRGDDFFPAFIASLRAGCMAAFDHSPPPEPAGPFRNHNQPLGLVDAQAIDEDSVLAGLASRHESRASHPLMLLSQRFAVLLERPPLSASELPVGPHAFGRALRHASNEIGLGLPARVALYDTYERDSANRFETTMMAVDALLDGMGVLPGLSFVPLRPKSVPAHPERGRGHSPAPGLVSEIVAMRTVNEAIDATVPEGLLPDERLAERREAVSAMVRLVSRHGPASAAWIRCREAMAEVIAAARERRTARPGVAEWIRTNLAELGYSEVECRRLSEALVHFGQDIAKASRTGAAAHAAAQARTPSGNEPDASNHAWRR